MRETTEVKAHLNSENRRAKPTIGVREGDQRNLLSSSPEAERRGKCKEGRSKEDDTLDYNFYKGRS